MNIKSVGVIPEDEMELCTVMISLLAPIAELSQPLQHRLEKFMEEARQDIVENYQDINLQTKKLKSEVLFHVGTGSPDENNKYHLMYTVSFIVWVGNQNDFSEYWRHSEPIAVELTEQDKVYLKKSAIEHVALVLA